MDKILGYLPVVIAAIGFVVYWRLAKRRRSYEEFIEDYRSGAFEGVSFSVVTPPSPYRMMALITLLVLGSALFVILSKQYDAGTEKWAYGAVGSIMGFWLKEPGPQTSATRRRSRRKPKKQEQEPGDETN